MKTLMFARVLPRNVCIGILHGYRAVISPLYGDVCRYYPSCSAYALESIRTHGVVKGVALGSARLARCHPWAAGGVDDVPEHARYRQRTSRFGFVTALERRDTAAAVHDHSPELHPLHQRKV